MRPQGAPEKVLVTGAHGFIGSHTCEHLLARGFAVRALVSPWGRTDSLHACLEHPAFELVRADIGVAEELSGICEGCGAVVHAAARVADWGPWAAFERVNVRGTEQLLAEAERGSVRRFVLVSSVAVHRYSGFYDADPNSVPRDNVRTPYARSKILAEDAVLASTLEGVVIRPGLWPFGPRDPNVRRVMAALKRGRLPLVGDGESRINTAYVGNLVLGLERALLAPLKDTRCFVIADAGAPSWQTLFATLAELLGVAPPRLKVSPALARPAARLTEGLYARFAPQREPPLTLYRAELMLEDVHFSIATARDILGYTPRFSWQEGLAATVASLGHERA